MKILVVTQYFWPEEFRINDICNGLVQKGHSVDVLTGLPNYPYGKFFEGYSFFNRGEKEYNGMKLDRCYLIPRGKNSSIKLALNYISFVITSLFHIPRYLFKNYNNIFVFNTSPITSAIPAIIISKIKRIPSSIYIQDLWPETFYSIINIKNRLIRKIMKRICTLIYNSFDQLLIASEGYREILIDSGIDENKIIYFPQWAEDLYSDVNINNEEYNNSPNKEFLVTFAGNIGKAQSVETIIEAANLAKENKNIKWIILGDGSEFSNISTLVEDYNLYENVKLLGRKPVSEMPKYFSKSDALIVTLKDIDILRITLPAKVQSYMASGKPIVGAISGEGNKVIEESKCGVTAQAEDANGLYESVMKLYNMTKEERQDMGINGKIYFEKNFKRDMLLDKLESYLTNISKNLNDVKEGMGDEQYV